LLKDILPKLLNLRLKTPVLGKFRDKIGIPNTLTSFVGNLQRLLSENGNFLPRLLFLTWYDAADDRQTDGRTDRRQTSATRNSADNNVSKWL